MNCSYIHADIMKGIHNICKFMHEILRIDIINMFIYWVFIG